MKMLVLLEAQDIRLLKSGKTLVLTTAGGKIEVGYDGRNKKKSNEKIKDK